jgi:hypothetical protein
MAAISMVLACTLFGRVASSNTLAVVIMVPGDCDHGFG